MKFIDIRFISLKFIDIRFISLKFIDIRFINLKFIDIRFIKLKKRLSGKKVTYLLIYEKRFYDGNVGFTKLIKVLKPR